MKVQNKIIFSVICKIDKTKSFKLKLLKKCIENK